MNEHIHKPFWLSKLKNYVTKYLLPNRMDKESWDSQNALKSSIGDNKTNIWDWKGIKYFYFKSWYFCHVVESSILRLKMFCFTENIRPATSSLIVPFFSSLEITTITTSKLYRTIFLYPYRKQAPIIFSERVKEELFLCQGLGPCSEKTLLSKTMRLRSQPNQNQSSFFSWEDQPSSQPHQFSHLRPHPAGGLHSHVLMVVPSRKFLAVLYIHVLNRFSHVWLFVTPWTVARQAPLSMGFSRQEYIFIWDHPQNFGHL